MVSKLSILGACWSSIRSISFSRELFLPLYCPKKSPCSWVWYLSEIEKHKTHIIMYCSVNQWFNLLKLSPPMAESEAMSTIQERRIEIHWTRKQQDMVFHPSSIHCWLWCRKLLIGFQHFKTRFWNQQDLLRCEHKSINLTQFTWLNATQTHAPWHSVLVFVHSFLANTGGLWVFIFFSTLRCIELWSHYEVSNKFYFIYVNIHQQAKCQKIFY